jgi:hypothetical protein
MSQVFSFRLDKNNPREAQAMRVIETWASRGYSLRYVMVEALFAYEEKGTRSEQYLSALDHIIALLDEFNNKPPSSNRPGNPDTLVSNSFSEAVASSARPGLRADKILR